MELYTERAFVKPSGDLSIPLAMRELLRLDPGAQLEISVDGGNLILRPVEETSPPREGFLKIKDLCGILSSEKGMVEELQNERRQDKW